MLTCENYATRDGDDDAVRILLYGLCLIVVSSCLLMD